MTDRIFRIVYGSRNRIEGEQNRNPQEVDAILAASRTNNARDGVTGALLYSDGCFVQVLEGDLAAVQRTFERIQRDERHSDVVVLEAAVVDERLFGKWDMALAEVADPTKAQTVLGRALKQPNDQAGSDVVHLLDDLVRRQQDWVQS